MYFRSRLLLGCLAAALAAPPLAAEPLAQPDDGPVLTRLVGEPRSARGQRISHGPILGRPTETGIGVWARTNKPAEFFVFYGTDPKRLTERSAGVTTRLENDNTAWVELDGLEPDSRYYYAVGFADVRHQPELSGSFRTLPSSAQYRNAEHNPEGLFNFSFAASGCARMGRSGSAGITPQRTMVENHADKVLFALHAGDFVYEEGRTTQVEEWLWRMGMGRTRREVARKRGCGTGTGRRLGKLQDLLRSQQSPGRMAPPGSDLLRVRRS